MTDLVLDPGQDRLIKDLYAWVAVDPKTNLEGICGIALGGMPMQAVCSSLLTALKIRDLVVSQSRALGKRVKLVRFSDAVVVEEF